MPGPAQALVDAHPPSLSFWISMSYRSSFAIMASGLLLGCTPEDIASKEPPEPAMRSTSMVRETGPSAPDACPNGGVTFDHGIDRNGDGVLAAAEATQTFVVCHGRDGASSYGELADAPDLSAFAHTAELAPVAFSGSYTDLADAEISATTAGPGILAAIEIVVPASGTPGQNGTNLLAAIAGITDASANKPYVVRLQRGTYDLGVSRVQMKSFVDIAGAGPLATTIVSAANDSGTDAYRSVILMASDVTLSGVTVTNTSTTYAGGIYGSSGPNQVIRDVRVIVDNANTQGHGVFMWFGELTMERTSVRIKGAAFDVRALMVRQANVTVIDSSLISGYQAIYFTGEGDRNPCTINLIRSVAVGTGYGVFDDRFLPRTVVSKLNADASRIQGATRGIFGRDNTFHATLFGSELIGGTQTNGGTVFTCHVSYNGSGVFLSSTCN